MAINQTSLGFDSPESEAGQNKEDNGASSKPRPSGAQTLASALKWVQDVLDLKDKFDMIWKISFNGDRNIEAAVIEVRLLLPFRESLLLTFEYRPLRRSSIRTINAPSLSRCLLTRTSKKVSKGFVSSNTFWFARLISLPLIENGRRS